MKRFSTSGKSGRPGNLLGTIILRPPDKTVTEKVVESQQISIKENSSNVVHDPQPQKGNVIDWFYGIVGGKPAETNQPGESQVVSGCPPCRVAVGWGATKQNGQTATKLQEVKVPIMSNVDCKKTGYGSRITDNMMCAGYPEGKKDSCQGDSGGPLLVQNGTAYQIVGIVSWGEGCAQANYPGVYTRVNRYISWIKSLTRDACYC
nr:unnamed protein product [Callosobruchus analis]